jgi:hypothetical protein
MIPMRSPLPARTLKYGKRSLEVNTAAIGLFLCFYHKKVELNKYLQSVKNPAIRTSTTDSMRGNFWRSSCRKKLYSR